MKKSIAFIVAVTLLSTPVIAFAPSDAYAGHGHKNHIKYKTAHKKHKRKRKAVSNAATQDHRNKVIIVTKGRKK